MEPRDIERVDEIDESIPYIAFILHLAIPTLKSIGK